MVCHDNNGATVAEMGEWQESGWKWKWQAGKTAAGVVVPAVSSAGVIAAGVAVPAVSNAGVTAPGFAAAATGFSAPAESSAAGLWLAFFDFFQGVQLSTIEEDRWIWLPDPVRSFSVNSCYLWLSERMTVLDAQSDEQEIKACKSLWKSDLPSKVLVFCWRVLLRKLPTRNNLLARGIISSLQEAVCIFCQKEVETCDHLFCNCEVVKEVWGSILVWLNVPNGMEDNVILMYESMGNLIKGKGANKVKWIFWAASVYQIWLARNNAIFNNKGATVSGIVNAIKIVSWGWFIARRGRSSGFNFAEWFSCPMGCISSL